MVVGVRWATLNVSETVDLSGSSHNHLCGLQSMVRKRENIQSAAVLQLKMICSCQSQRRMARLLQVGKGTHDLTTKV